MVERGEIITVCRQIGGMMEAGVDILRITRVLRAQTENQRLLQVYNALDHDLTMGKSLVEAMANAPDVWSPFDVSLVQQGESRNDLAGAFYKIADFLQKEDELHEATQGRDHHAEPQPTERVVEVPSEPPIHIGSPMTVIALDGLIDRLQTFGLRFLTVTSGLLLTLASVWLAVEQGWLEPRWINMTLCSVAALFIGGMGIWVQRRLEADRRREARCSFCGTYSPDGVGLERAPRFAGAAICSRCAAIVARRHPADGNEVIEGEMVPPPAQEATQNGAVHANAAGGAEQNVEAAPANNGHKNAPHNEAGTPVASGLTASGRQVRVGPARPQSQAPTRPAGEEDYD